MSTNKDTQPDALRKAIRLAMVTSPGTAYEHPETVLDRILAAVAQERAELNKRNDLAVRRSVELSVHLERVIDGRDTIAARCKELEAQAVADSKLISEHQAKSDEYVAMRVRCAELEQDKARLDWLEANGRIVCGRYMDGFYLDTLRGTEMDDWICKNGQTLREAIDACADAARKQEGSK